MAETLTVKRSQLVPLFMEGLKVETAEDWKKDQFEKKLGDISRYKDDPNEILKDRKQNELYDKILQANKDGVKVAVDWDEPAGATETAPGKKTPAKAPPKEAPSKTKPAAPKPPEPAKTPAKAPAKTAAKGKAKTAAKQEPTNGRATAGGVWYAKYKNNPAPFSDRGPGVGKRIVEILLDAGQAKEKGISKEAVHKKIKAEFRDRDATKLWTSVNNLIPSRLRQVRGITVLRDTRDGDSVYWIPEGGVPEAPVAEKTEKPAKAAAKTPAAKKQEAKKRGKKAAA